MTKGLKLTKEFIQKLAMQKDDIFNINECIEPFISFDWNGFDQQEFFHLIDSFKELGYPTQRSVSKCSRLHLWR